MGLSRCSFGLRFVNFGAWNKGCEANSCTRFPLTFLATGVMFCNFSGLTSLPGAFPPPNGDTDLALSSCLFTRVCAPAVLKGLSPTFLFPITSSNGRFAGLVKAAVGRGLMSRGGSGLVSSGR